MLEIAWTTKSENYCKKVIPQRTGICEIDPCRRETSNGVTINTSPDSLLFFSFEIVYSKYTDFDILKWVLVYFILKHQNQCILMYFESRS